MPADVVHATSNEVERRAAPSPQALYLRRVRSNASWTHIEFPDIQMHARAICHLQYSSEIDGISCNLRQHPSFCVSHLAVTRQRNRA